MLNRMVYQMMLASTGDCCGSLAIVITCSFWRTRFAEIDEKNWNGEAKHLKGDAAFLIDTKPIEKLEDEFATYLGVDHLSDIMMRLKWLGIFEPEVIKTKNGSKLDVFIELLLMKLTYAPGETDMTIIHVDILAELPGGKQEHRTATMVADGEPNGDSAMAKAVGLPRQ